MSNINCQISNSNCQLSNTREKEIQPDTIQSNEKQGEAKQWMQIKAKQHKEKQNNAKQSRAKQIKAMKSNAKQCKEMQRNTSGLECHPAPRIICLYICVCIHINSGSSVQEHRILQQPSFTRGHSNARHWTRHWCCKTWRLLRTVVRAPGNLAMMWCCPAALYYLNHVRSCAANATGQKQSGSATAGSLWTAGSSILLESTLLDSSSAAKPAGDQLDSCSVDLGLHRLRPRIHR